MIRVNKQFQESQLDFDVKIQFHVQSKIVEYKKSIVRY